MAVHAPDRTSVNFPLPLGPEMLSLTPGQVYVPWDVQLVRRASSQVGGVRHQRGARGHLPVPPCPWVVPCAPSSPDLCLLALCFMWCIHKDEFCFALQGFPHGAYSATEHLEMLQCDAVP